MTHAVLTFVHWGCCYGHFHSTVAEMKALEDPGKDRDAVRLGWARFAYPDQGFQALNIRP